MTRIVAGKLFLEEEPSGRCEQCSKIAELRPYGPNGSNICVDCGKKDPLMDARMIKVLNKLVSQAAQGVVCDDPDRRN